ncbi:MAG TPA: right-handed parallel beta-helix repeat-containing protein [Candidatus Limnocylindrales bacterium]|nr:right-handed parallel beta-helix repeat-containing protein [Candidatus Limnocylindrales bacterium]
MRQRITRAVLGGMVAVGALAMAPASVSAAQPACGDSLTTSTTLTADLDCSGYNGTALYMGHNGVVLNLNGHTIWGYTGDDSNSGVDTDGYDNTKVTNGTIANFGYGVYMVQSGSTKLTQLDIVGEAADTGDYGVYQDYGAGNRVANSDISGVQYGIYSQYASNLQVLNNTIDADYIGVETYYDSRDRFENNVVTADSYGFYDDYSGNLVYVGNRSNGGDYGWYLDCSSYGKVTLKNNVANNNSDYGFYLYECYGSNTSYAPGTGSKITGNTANNNGTGFYDYYSINSVWTSNVAHDNDDDGFYLEYPGGVDLTYNKANRNGDTGFELSENYSSGYYNVYRISWNTANQNSYGFYAAYGAPGKGNVANNNSSDNCYNVRCN